MKLTKESNYAVSALAYMASFAQDTIHASAAVAKATQIPPTFLSKILGKLTRAEILVAHRGHERGFSFARPMRDISLRQVLEAIDGPSVLTRCIFWSGTCSDGDPCDLHPIWKDVRPRLATQLEETSLADIARDPGTIPTRT